LAASARSGLFNGFQQHLKQLLQRYIRLIEFSQFFTRQDIVNFYQDIAIQIVWRPYIDEKRIKLFNPLKLVNAASFGIPTIALEERAFVEMKGYYFPVGTIEEFIAQLDELQTSPTLYEDYAQRCIQKSENYHIDNISRMYQQLN